MVTRYDDDDDEYHEDDVSDDEEPIKRSRTSKSSTSKCRRRGHLLAGSLERTPWTSRLLYRKLRRQLCVVETRSGRGRNLHSVCLPFSRTSGYPRAPETQAGARRAGRSSSASAAGL